MSSERLSPIPLDLIVDEQHADQRLDVFLARHFPQHSRVHLRRLINAAAAKVDDQRVKAAYRLRVGQKVTVFLPPLPRGGPEPENIPLDVVFEDEHFAVVNKPSGMVVHPAKGHWSGTLTAALAYRFQQLSSAGGPTRPGIVHRLDRDTSGVMVVAKTDTAHYCLAAQFEQRSVTKEYLAIVVGVPDRDRDVIERQIGVHPYQREKMAIRESHSTSRDARTFYEVLERFRGFAAVAAMPKTGRTHQIRLHLAHIGCPVLCDRLYGGRARVSRNELRGGAGEDAVLLERQALHARRLAFHHPVTGEPVEFEAPLPADMQDVLEELRRSRMV